MMRKTIWMGAVVCLAVGVPMVAQTMQQRSLKISKDNRTLSISASDHAEADPDVAEVHVGFTAYGVTLKAAYKSASDISNGIVKGMLDAGATQKEIQSESQRVSRLQDYEVKVQKGMRYSVQQSWTVSAEPKNAALILDAAVQAGANQSGAINWRMKSSVALDGEALRRATERAHSMAEVMAKSLGVTLGRPLYASNAVSGVLDIPVNGRNFVAGYSGVVADKAAPLAIEAQRVDRTATVEIVYAIE